MKQLLVPMLAVALPALVPSCKDPAPAPPSGVGAITPGLPPGHPPSQLDNLPAPPSGDISGELRVSDAVKGKVAEGDTIFIIARNAATGSLIAVTRAQVGATFPVPFKLTGADIMHSQTSLAGKVKLEARVDKDGDAMTKNAGDIVGETRDLVSIPTAGAVVTLDTIL